VWTALFSPCLVGFRPSLLGSSCSRWDLVLPYSRPTAGCPADPIGVSVFRIKVMRSGRVPPVRRGLGVRSQAKAFLVSKVARYHRIIQHFDD